MLLIRGGGDSECPLADMTTIERLGILGIRSYGPEQEQVSMPATWGAFCCLRLGACRVLRA